MKLVEKVARAMYETNQFVRGWDHPKTAAMWHEIYRRKAIAALKAMREPTEAMVVAGVHHDNMGDMAGRWQAMIDAAISEAETP
jgi:hypothetical protein